MFMTPGVDNRTHESLLSTEERLRLTRIFKQVCASPQNRQLHDAVRVAGMEAGFASLPESHIASCPLSDIVQRGGALVSVARPGDFLVLNRTLPDGELVRAAAHEWQHFAQIIGNAAWPLGIHAPPEGLIWHQRGTEADAEANNIVGIVEAFTEGKTEAFDILLETKADCYRPMLLAAYKAACADFRALTDGRAKRAAFDAWFAGPQVEGYDYRTIWSWQQYNAAFSARAAAPPRGPLRAADIEKIGAAQADGINYLALPGFRPLDDAYYTGNISENNRAALAGPQEAWEKARRAQGQRPPSIT